MNSAKVFTIAAVVSSVLVSEAFAGAIKYNQVPGDMSWPGGKVPYVFNADVSSERRKIFIECVRAWQQFGNIRFVPTTENSIGIHQSPAGNYLLVQRNDIRFRESVKDVNYAWIGRSGNIGFPVAAMQPMSIQNWHHSVVAHEMGHTLGFIHEQMRMDRDEFVTLNWDQINGWTTINFNKERSTYRTTYDYYSIMHYNSIAFRDDHKNGYTIVPHDPAMLTVIGSKEGSPGNAREAEKSWLGQITYMMSDGDRQTIGDEYGRPTHLNGVVSLNGEPMPFVTVELVANGTSQDEQAFIDMLHVTEEHSVMTGENGEFWFRGIPTGNFRVQMALENYSFNGPTWTVQGGNSSTVVLEFGAINTETEPPTASILKPVELDNQNILDISGKARDLGGSGLKDVQLTVSSGTHWYNWDTQEFGPAGETFSEGPHALEITTFTGMTADEWTLPLPVLNKLGTEVPDGVVVLNVRGRDSSNNASVWRSTTFTLDRVKPVVTINNAANDAPFFDFQRIPTPTGKELLGGTVTDATDPSPEPGFRIGIADLPADESTYWTGTSWERMSISDKRCELPAVMENGRWRPKDLERLPKRKDLTEGTSYVVSAFARDDAENYGFPTGLGEIRVRATGPDTTFPEVTIDGFDNGDRFGVHEMPQLRGGASDEESGVQGVKLYFMRYGPDLAAANVAVPFRYWNGEEWTLTPGHLAVQYSKTLQRWSAPGLDYRMPTGAAELPDGTYKVQATAFNRETPQMTLLMEKTFYIATAPPQVSITTPAHNGFVKQGWSIGGTATDYSGTGFSNNRVTFTLVGSDGRYWDGAAWNVTQRVLEADIQPDGTWSYPGTESGASLPVGETQYALSASVMDRNGNISLPIAGGVAGNNQILFRVDTTPPTCVIVSPLNNAEITQSPLLASSFNGTATDSSGQPQVTLFVKRLSDNYYWTGSMWTTNSTQAIMPGVYAEPLSEAWALQKSFPCLNRYFWGMQNGNYELIAIARDLAGNQTQRSANIVINYNPVWLAPQDLLARVQPKQTAPITGGLGTTQVHISTPWLTGQPGNGGNVYPVSFTADSQGRYFVTNGLTERVFFGNKTRDINHGVIQRIGEGAWRRQRTTYSETSGPTINYYEQWSPGGTPIQISNYEAGIYHAELAKAKTDPAGNTYAAFNLLQHSGSPNFLIDYRSHVMLVKFDADGNLVWRRVLPEMGQTAPTGWLERCQVSAIELHADGGVSVVIDNTSSYHPSIYYENTVVARVSPTGVAQAYTRLGSQSNPYELSAPLYSTTDAFGNTYVITRDSNEGAGYSRQVLRKIGSGGSILATLETSLCVAPQYWEALSTDAAGNVYVLSTFELGNDDGRCCVTKYDSSLNQVWRRFGPERSVYIDPYSGPAGGDYRFHVGSQGVTVSHSAPASLNSEYPDAHPLVLRFSLSGDLLWTRAIAKTDTSVYGTDGLSLLNVTPAGDVLFFGWLSLGNSMAQPIYGKISNTGDLQFYMNQTDPWGVSLTTLLPDNRLVALHSSGYSLSPSGEQRVLIYDNPANVAIPVTLDSALPGSRTVTSGETVEFKVVNRGSLGTYQWRKEDGLGMPQNISGATGDTLLLTNIQAANAGRYSCVVTNSVDSATSRTAVLTVLQTTTLDVALDTPGRTWTTGGDLPWSGFLAPSPNRDGVDAAASGSIGDNQSSWVETVVTGPLEVKFWWKISAEYQADTLSFTVNGTQVGNSIHWEQDWIQVTHTVGAGQHTLRWTYARDSSGGGGSNKAWLDSFTAVVPPFTVPLPEALDTALTFTTGGNAVWRGIGPTPSHDGVDAAVSGDIHHSQLSWMETTVTGPGTLTYWWKVSSEGGFDYLEFYRNNALQTGRISGNVDWQLKTYTIPTGTHTLRWSYMKDFIVDGGLDLAWVDQVVWTPDAPTFNSWQTSKFTSAQLADPLISDHNANPNHDDVNNLLAFALNLDPLAPGVTQSDAITQGMSGTGPTDHLILHVKLPDPLPVGITYTIEVPNGPNMSSWIPITSRTSLTNWTGSATVTQDAPLNGCREVHIHDIVNQGASDGRFMRLRVTIP